MNYKIVREYYNLKLPPRYHNLGIREMVLFGFIPAILIISISAKRDISWKPAL